jgi:cell division septation protein DedD
MAGWVARIAPLALALCAAAAAARAQEPPDDDDAADEAPAAVDEPERPHVHIVFDRDGDPSRAGDAAPAVTARSSTPGAEVARTEASTSAAKIGPGSVTSGEAPEPMHTLPPLGPYGARPLPGTDDTAFHDFPPPGEGWRIQVGAFWDAARANEAIAAVELLAAGAGADPVRLVTPADGDHLFYRAQIGGFVDRAAAEAACARILTSGRAGCILIRPDAHSGR